jgi:hypothetical protein
MQATNVIMKRILILAVFAAALAVKPASAQMPGMGRTPGMNPAMTKMFGDNKNFTANAELNLQDQKQGAPMSMAMVFIMSDGKMRTELDMTQIKGGQFPPSAMASMKQMGMDKMVSISRPDKKVTYMVYPNLKAYAEMPMSEQQTAAMGKDVKIEKTSLGKETINGHPCEKNKVVLTDDQGAHEILVWNATDLHDFPAQMQMTESGSTVLIAFKDIKLDQPNAALFETPAGLTKYDSPQQLMQTEMMKRMGGGK